MSTEYSHYDNEYYIITREGNDNYPLVCIDEENLCSLKSGGMFASPGPLIQDGYVFPVKLNDPIPQNPEIVDFHPRPYMFSYRVIQDVAQRYDIPGVQWLPACIRHDGNEYRNYVIMHTFNKLKVLNESESDLTRLSRLSIDLRGIVLDKKVLDQLPESERLIFKLKEKSSLIFMHQSIVDEIMKHEPKGVRFVKSKDWSVGIGFK